MLSNLKSNDSLLRKTVAEFSQNDKMADVESWMPVHKQALSKSSGDNSFSNAFHKMKQGHATASTA